MLYLLGPARSVAAELDRFEAWYEGEDQASVMIRFSSRVIAQTDHSWCNQSARDFLMIAGTSGQAIVEDLEANRILLQIGKAVHVIDAEVRPQATHRAIVMDFCRALRGGDSVRCPGWDGMRATQLIELAYQAARERRTVDVPPIWHGK